MGALRKAKAFEFISLCGKKYDKLTLYCIVDRFLALMSNSDSYEELLDHFSIIFER